MNLAELGPLHLPNGWTLGSDDGPAEGKCGLLVLIGYLDTLEPGAVMSHAAARCVADHYGAGTCNSATWVFQATGAIVGTVSCLYDRLLAGTGRTAETARVRSATLEYLYSRRCREPVPGWELLVLR